MSVSLTSSGLYLEPRAYTDGSGNNYGTPKFVSSSTSLGGGTWSGVEFESYEKYNSSNGKTYTLVRSSVKANVSSSSKVGGDLLQSLLTQSLEREVA